MERLDTLPNKMFIWQSTDEFKFTLDAVLLAAFPVLKAKMKIADLGAGTGAVSMLAAARAKVDLTSIEINENVAKLLKKSIEKNALQEDIKVLVEDIRNIKNLLPSGCMDMVFCNPPYRKIGHGRLRKGGAETACHEGLGETADFITAASWLLKHRGRLVMVHLPERLPEIMNECIKNKLEPKRLQFVYANTESKPKAFLLEAMYGSSPGLNVEKAFFVYDSNGEYSEQLLNSYKSFSNFE